MRKVAIAFVALIIFASCASGSWGDKIVVCGDTSLKIVDVTKSNADTSCIIWEWDIADAKDQLPDDFQARNVSLDDCKPVNNGTQILVTSSSGSTILLDIATRKCLFYARTPMAHSAELLPGNRIVVANSTHPLGNSLELYNIEDSDLCVWKDTLYSGHGAVWNKKRSSLYALGYVELRRYTLQDWDSARPSLKLEQTWPLPGNSGHDLVPCGEERLIVTMHEGVFVFDCDKGEFTPFQPLAGIQNIKSVNYNPDTRRLVYTKAETEWWTDHVYFDNPALTLSLDPDYHMYKVRVFASPLRHEIF